MSSRVGDLLVKSGAITQAQLGEALAALGAAGTVGSSGTLVGQLVKMGLVEERSFAALLSQHYGVPVVELENFSFGEGVSSLIPQHLSLKHGVVPLVQQGHSLSIAISDPSDLSALNDLRFITGLDLKVMVAPERSIRAARETLYETRAAYDRLIDDFRNAQQPTSIEQAQTLELSALQRATEDAPVVKLVNAILADAIKKRASDIHIEPYEERFRVRFRIDGVLKEIMSPPAKLKNAITSRLKIMADLDIAERRLPQDGRIKLRLGAEGEMDFRVNVLPTLFGEKVVLRLLDKSNVQFDLTKLGFEAQQQRDFIGAISRPHGMILVTGPTGSGKTTTLYSALAELNKITTNISTIEDPVEINLAGINQAQTHDEIGFSFASALRALLRQDPDVIMLGEIRDLETAEIAIKASLTGHLVLSTLHTNDAPSAVTRLLNMGVEPFLVASSISLVMAQRLVRKICPDCSAPVTLSPEALLSAGLPPEEVAGVGARQGKGCTKCAQTGYRGRIAVYEVMPLTEEIRQGIVAGWSASQVKKEAIRQGMQTLRISALQRLKDGVTTLEEILRVTATD